MVQYQRLIRKGEKLRVSVNEKGGSFAGTVAGGGFSKIAKPKIILVLFLSFLSCCYIFSFSSFSLLNSFSREPQGFGPYEQFIAPLCSGTSNGTICCDRTGFRSDVCIMKGDVRTNSASSSVFLFTSLAKKTNISQKIIKPYTRKWETSVMQTVQQLNLVYRDQHNSSVSESDDVHNIVCDVFYDVPAVFFSTGGYTGNVYHEFNDGIIPLFITSHHFNKKVVFVIVEYHSWWVMKYGDIVSQLSDYPPVDFNGDKRTHCFKEAIVGLKIHDELTVDSSLMHGNKTILDFRNVLDRAYWPRIRGLIQEEELEAVNKTGKRVGEDVFKKPKLVILSRNGSREILNESLLVELAEEIGFSVEVLRPDKTTELAKIYRCLNSSNVMIGVHGAAMTHFLFLKPKTVFIQIIPIGTEWAAETYYGKPAKKMGLKYISYKIKPKESSLYDEYGKDDPIIRDPKSFTQKGWDYTKKIYLERQNVKLDLIRFKKPLSRAYDFSMKRI
ncbi:PREDICTED: EGF domain-specific O-linked N-acetylglucosamine transferase isoform X1 [Camelina sativa]|uniref:EGF domain-specific O-linked N-acetylglucosamine transferase isoform X1 n=2 Tax=Camelina sativa TaxID=90675 RepID=A0ABM0TK68_CAMSA|nr:PREDICTED: EGF domain-specific O-linked N-acetylglucosamine transferase isoform X1 [Camelina sativa]